MSFKKFALVASVFALAACGGKSESAPATEETAATPAPAKAAPAAAPAAVTGTTHDVKMLLDAKGVYRFEPAELTVKAGDAVRYVFVSGGPHNVAFDPAGLTAEVKKQLDSNIPSKIGELASIMMMNEGESVTVSFFNIPAGKYNYHCTPHLAMNMKGVITVQ